MPKLYCPHCYKPTVYESNRPNFCSECGKPYINNINSSINTPINTQTRPSQPMRPIVKNEIEEDITVVPDIDKIDFDIDENLRPKRERLSLNIQNNGNSVIAKKNLKLTKSQNISKKQIQSEWENQEIFKKNVRHNSTEI